MVCLYCASSTRVVNSRHQKRPNQVWRRRQCTTCGAVFTSHEAAELANAWAVSGKTGRPAPFVKERLFLSIYKSCRHRKTAIEDAAALTDTVIVQSIRHAVNGLIQSKQIAAECLKVLHRFDTAAAIQYEAYHRQTLA